MECGLLLWMLLSWEGVSIELKRRGDTGRGSVVEWAGRHWGGAKGRRGRAWRRQWEEGESSSGRGGAGWGG